MKTYTMLTCSVRIILGESILDRPSPRQSLAPCHCGAWLLLTTPFSEPLAGTAAVDDEVFAEVKVCSKVSSCERSKVRNLP
jgi:hypothetical protein